MVLHTSTSIVSLATAPLPSGSVNLQVQFPVSSVWESLTVIRHSSFLGSAVTRPSLGLGSQGFPSTIKHHSWSSLLRDHVQLSKFLSLLDESDEQMSWNVTRVIMAQLPVRSGDFLLIPRLQYIIRLIRSN